MKKTRAYACSCLLFVVAPILTQIPIAKPLGKGSAAGDKIPEASRQRLVETYGRLPLTFEANQGQTDHSVQFLARGSGYTMFLTANEAVLALRKSEPRPQGSGGLNPSRDRKGAVA